MRRTIALTGVVVLLLAGCHSPVGSGDKVSVTGDVGVAPVVSFSPPLTVSRAETREVWPGSGPVLRDGQQVLMNYLAKDAENGDVVGETYSTGPVAKSLSLADLGRDLYEALRDHRSGARLVHLAPAVAGEGAALVMVVDLLPTRAVGDAVPPRPGLPVVTRAADGAPKIRVPEAAAPTDLVVQPLIKGSGEQVFAGQTVVVQYTGVSWVDGKVVDSTWVKDKTPFTTEIGVGKVIQGWDEGLVEQTVGSQVLLVIPPALGYGDKTLVFVVDILATAGKSASGPTASASATATKKPSAKATDAGDGP